MSNQTSENNKRIAKNTIMLYLRMFLTMVVGLYTSRVVLQTLGVEDYGIYGVVGGIVAMMGFLNASMSGATSRFLTFELGRGDKERLSKTFSSALVVHIIIAAIVFVVAETVRKNVCYVFLMPLPLFVWNVLVLMLLALILTTNCMRISRTLL